MTPDDDLEAIELPDDDDPDAPWNQPCEPAFLDLNDY